MSEPTPLRHDYAAVLHRLNRASVHKNFDAYADVAWDAPEFRIDPEDPRWELPRYEPLAATDWYQQQPLALRARMGLDLVAARLKVGAEFENILSRGLLAFATHRPNGSPAFRYAYHELIEEGQHSLMFQEFVNRAGTDPRGIPPLQRFLSVPIPSLGWRFPELFFVFVLVGEVPVDTLQRRGLRAPSGLHPLLRRITQIHVTEEARHMCFAEHYLREHLPGLSRFSGTRLRVMAPFITHITARLILQTPSWLLTRYDAPAAVTREVQSGPVARQLATDMLQPLLSLYSELGVITDATAPLWHALGYTSARPRLGSGSPNALTP